MTAEEKDGYFKSVCSEKNRSVLEAVCTLPCATQDQISWRTSTGAALIENNEASAKHTTANGRTFT